MEQTCKCYKNFAGVDFLSKICPIHGESKTQTMDKEQKSACTQHDEPCSHEFKPQEDWEKELKLYLTSAGDRRRAIHFMKKQIARAKIEERNSKDRHDKAWTRGYVQELIVQAKKEGYEEGKAYKGKLCRQWYQAGVKETAEEIISEIGITGLFQSVLFESYLDFDDAARAHNDIVKRFKELLSKYLNKE